MSVPSPNDPVIQELTPLDASVAEVLKDRDSASRLLDLLPDKYQPKTVVKDGGARVWELAALWFLNTNRIHEALGLFWRLYLQMTVGQCSSRSHKGMPLVWISDCYTRLGFVVHAKRYLILTLVEDALREQGVVTPNTSGVYFRLEGLGDRSGQVLEQLAEYLMAAFAGSATSARTASALRWNGKAAHAEGHSSARPTDRQTGDREAGIHILRHSFCSHLAMRGAPARAIQELAGHQDRGTTQRYMHLSPAALDAANRPEFWREPARVIESRSHMMVPLAVTMSRSLDPLGLMF